MPDFKQRQIWLVNFDPSFGHEYKKVRPALVLQDDAYISSSNLLAVTPISSKISKKTELDVLVKRDSQNRLLSDSLVKTKQISSFDKRRFFKCIGVLNDRDFQKVIQNLKTYFGM